MNSSILDVASLTVEFDSIAPVISDVSFSLSRGKVLALVGESGSGKTTLCRALTRLYPPHSPIRIAGKVLFRSTNLLTCSETELQSIRQGSIRYVLQEPYAALNPLTTVERHMMLAGGARIAQEYILQLLTTVGLRHPERLLRHYPHQLSIGMAQRVMVAMALLPQPSLLIADEPTSALDASLRKQLLDLLKSIQQKTQMAMILVTHDLAVARRYADEIAVLKEGRIVETGTIHEFFRQAHHAYSQLLLETLMNRGKRTITTPHFENGTHASPAD